MGGTFFILIFLFSGQNIQLGSFKFETIQLDTEFILKNLTFIAEGLGQTLLISDLPLPLPFRFAVRGVGQAFHVSADLCHQHFLCFLDPRNPSLPSDFLLLPGFTATWHHPIRDICRGNGVGIELWRLHV